MSGINFVSNDLWKLIPLILVIICTKWNIMRLKQPMIAELDRNELARILQDNHSSCKILQDSHRLARSCKINVFFFCKIVQDNHFLQESWKILQDNHLVLTRGLLFHGGLLWERPTKSWIYNGKDPKFWRRSRKEFCIFTFIKVSTIQGVI